MGLCRPLSLVQLQLLIQRAGSTLNSTPSGAGFKFNSLRLTGNPTVLTAGGEVNLGLIAINADHHRARSGWNAYLRWNPGLALSDAKRPDHSGTRDLLLGFHDINFTHVALIQSSRCACDISASNDIRLYGENAIQVTGNLSTQRLAARPEQISASAEMGQRQ